MLRCVEVHVRDPEEAAKFIEKVFKIERSIEREWPKEITLPTGLAVLSFFQRPFSTSESPSVMVCMAVDCLETTLADLTEIGAKILEGPSIYGDQRYLVVDSECGYYLQVSETAVAASNDNSM